MKKLLLFFISVFLLGPSLCAQTPDWNKFPAAKEILDNMINFAERGFSLEYAMEKCPDTYSNAKILELVSISGLDNIPLAQCADYLTRAKDIMKIILTDEGWVASSLRDEEKKAEENLNKRPLKHFIERLVKLGAIDPKDGKEFTEKVAEDALTFFLNKELNKDDFDAILGTDLDGGKDGFLSLWDQYLSGEAGVALFPKVRDLKLKLLCSNTNLTAAAVAGIMLNPYGADMGRRLVYGITKTELNDYLNEYLKTVNIDLRAGIASQVMDHFDIISGLIGE